MGIRKAFLRKHKGFWFLVFLSVLLMFHIKEHGEEMSASILGCVYVKPDPFQ